MVDKNMSVMDKEVERELERFDPFRALDPFREFRAVFSAPAAWIPRADVRETDKEYIIDLSLPGLRKEDVKVEVKDDILTVSGERKSEKEEKGKSWLRRESSYGSFLRSFALPEGLHSEDIKASCKDGVLTLSMRKPSQVKTRGISIKVD